MTLSLVPVKRQPQLTLQRGVVVLPDMFELHFGAHGDHDEYEDEDVDGGECILESPVEVLVDHDVVLRPIALYVLLVQLHVPVLVVDHLTHNYSLLAHSLCSQN